MPEETTTEAETISIICFCPVCCSNIDVEGQDGETVTPECVTCEVSFTLKLDAAKIAKHSMYG